MIASDCQNHNDLIGTSTYKNFQDVSSQEFKALAASTYEKVLPCIMSAWMMKGRSNADFQFPDDAQQHFELIRNITASYRYAPIHEYAGYEGFSVFYLMANKPFTFHCLRPLD